MRLLAPWSLLSPGPLEKTVGVSGLAWPRYSGARLKDHSGFLAVVLHPHFLLLNVEFLGAQLMALICMFHLLAKSYVMESISTVMMIFYSCTSL